MNTINNLNDIITAAVNAAVAAVMAEQTKAVHENVKPADNAKPAKAAKAAKPAKAAKAAGEAYFFFDSTGQEFYTILDGTIVKGDLARACRDFERDAGAKFAVNRCKVANAIKLVNDPTLVKLIKDEKIICYHEGKTLWFVHAAETGRAHKQNYAAIKARFTKKRGGCRYIVNAFSRATKKVEAQ